MFRVIALLLRDYQRLAASLVFAGSFILNLVDTETYRSTIAHVYALDCSAALFQIGPPYLREPPPWSNIAI
ncbi:hypothetical protein [Asaia bogorensis]|uniref:hypothetical protein n=1 Tax=Asaia bogorensis TaxID=91915 RepID=UPI000EFB0F6A|nr:hypothetical protein [Asaia bogorensis]